MFISFLIHYFVSRSLHFNYLFVQMPSEIICRIHRLIYLSCRHERCIFNIEVLMDRCVLVVKVERRGEERERRSELSSSHVDVGHRVLVISSGTMKTAERGNSREKDGTLIAFVQHHLFFLFSSRLFFSSPSPPFCFLFLVLVHSSTVCLSERTRTIQLEHDCEKK